MKDRFRKTFEVHLYDLSSHKQLNPVKMVDCFNDAAGSHSESVGYSVESIFKKGYAWILLSWNIRVEEIPQLREKVLIETWISQIKRCFVNREFIMMNNLNQILIRASSRWIFYHIHKKRPAKIFSELSNQWTINSEEACHPSIMTSVFLKQPIYGNREKTFLVQEKDIDILNHVHNSKYIDWVIEVKPEMILNQHKLKHLQVLYHHEVKYPGEIMIRQQLMSPKNDDKQLFYDVIWDKNKHRISAEIATKWEYAC